MPAISERILELDIDLERYVQIRIVVCTICTGNGEPPRGGNPGPGACENRGGANVLEVPGYLRLIGEYGAVWGYSRCNIKCKRGANGCKGVTRTISPVNPGGQERPGTYLVGWGSTPVGETAANRIRTISLTPAEHLHDHHPAGPGAHRREPPLLPHFLRSPALQRPDPALELLGSHLRCSRSGPLARRVSIRRSRSVMLPSTTVTRGWSRRCSMFTRRPVARLSMMMMSWCCARYDVSLETEQERRQE